MGWLWDVRLSGDTEAPGKNLAAKCMVAARRAAKANGLVAAARSVHTGGEIGKKRRSHILWEVREKGT